MAEHDTTKSLPPVEPMKLSEMVEYATGSIVSRTVAEVVGGTITLFAFDAGQGLSEHSAPFDAFVQVIDGQVELTIGEQSVTAKSGEVVIMPANIPHAVRANQPCKMLLIMLRS